LRSDLKDRAARLFQVVDKYVRTVEAASNKNGDMSAYHVEL